MLFFFPPLQWQFYYHVIQSITNCTLAVCSTNLLSIKHILPEWQRMLSTRDNIGPGSSKVNKKLPLRFKKKREHHSKKSMAIKITALIEMFD